MSLVCVVCSQRSLRQADPSIRVVRPIVMCLCVIQVPQKMSRSGSHQGCCATRRKIFHYDLYSMNGGPSSSVGIATGYELDGPGIESLWGEIFRTCPDRTVAQTSYCTMGSGSFPGVKYGRGVLLTTYPLLLPRSWKSRVIPLPTFWATTRPVTGTLYLYSMNNLMAQNRYCHQRA